MIDLPADTVAKLTQFGRHELNPRKYPAPDPSIYLEYYTPAQADPAGFVTALAAAVVPFGGWAAYGAMRMLREVFTEPSTHPDADQIRVSALTFLRRSGVPSMFLNMQEWQFWVEHCGNGEYWLTAGAPPDRVTTVITPLQSGEVRRVARLTATRTSNVVYVHADGAEHVAEIEAPHDFEQPERNRRPWHQASTLYDLYLWIADNLQVPPYWCDAELMRFFSLPRPAVDIY